MDNPITFCYALDAHSIDVTFGSGSSGTSIILNANASSVNGFYNGCILTWNGVTKTVTGYNGTSKEAGISSAFATNPTVADTYRMQMQLTLDALAVRGANDADETDMHPNDEVIRLLNGNFYSNPPTAFNRIISVSLGIVELQTSRVFLHNFHYVRYYNSIIYDAEEICVIPPSKKFLNEWMQGVESMKTYNVTLYERIARTTNPSSWS